MGTPRVSSGLHLLPLVSLLACGGDREPTPMEAGTTDAGTTDASSPTSAAETTEGFEDETTSGTADESESEGGSDVPVASACDLSNPECPEGFKCTWSWNLSMAVCVPLARDPVDVGEPCTAEDAALGLDDCAAGSLCLHLDEQQEGECVAYCSSDMAGTLECEDGHACHVTATGPPLCLALCHPLEEPCAPGKVCVQSGSAFGCVLDDSQGGGHHGDPCELVNQCAPGFFCASAQHVPGCEGIGCCSPYCDLSDPEAECPGADAGQTCIPWYEATAPEGYEDLGACGLAD